MLSVLFLHRVLLQPASREWLYSLFWSFEGTKLHLFSLKNKNLANFAINKDFKSALVFFLHHQFLQKKTSRGENDLCALICIQIAEATIQFKFILFELLYCKNLWFSTYIPILHCFFKKYLLEMILKMLIWPFCKVTSWLFCFFCFLLSLRKDGHNSKTKQYSSHFCPTG